MAGAHGEERSPALVFVNTDRIGPTGSDDDLADAVRAQTWLRQHDYKPSVFFGPDLKRLVALRAAIRELFTARAAKKVGGKQAVALVNREAAADPTAPQLTWKRTMPSAADVSRKSGMDAIAAALARDAIAVVTGELGGMLQPCGAEDCKQFYFRDHGRRQWCSTTCGDRVRQRRRANA